MTATGPWTPINKIDLVPGRCYLIPSQMVGPVLDVAFYEGKKPDGSPWWVMGDVDINPQSIIKVAELYLPDDDK